MRRSFRSCKSARSLLLLLWLNNRSLFLYSFYFTYKLPTSISYCFLTSFFVRCFLLNLPEHPGKTATNLSRHGKQQIRMDWFLQANASCYGRTWEEETMFALLHRQPLAICQKHKHNYRYVLQPMTANETDHLTWVQHRTQPGGDTRFSKFDRLNVKSVQFASSSV